MLSCTAVVSFPGQAPLDFFLRGTVDGKPVGLLEECLGQMICVSSVDVIFWKGFRECALCFGGIGVGIILLKYFSSCLVFPGVVPPWEKKCLPGIFQDIVWKLQHLLCNLDTIAWHYELIDLFFTPPISFSSCKDLCAYYPFFVEK